MRLDILKKVEATSKRTEKAALLRGIDPETDKVTVRLLQMALDPYTTFGITVDPVHVTSALGSGDELGDKLWGAASKERRIGSPSAGNPSAWWRGLIAILEGLAKREVTGNAASSMVVGHLVEAPSVDAADWAMRVVNKDLRCGVNVKTIMDVFPGLVNPFSVQLATPTTNKWGHLIPGLEDMLRGTWFIEPKYDGLRGTVVHGRPMSRLGNELDGVGHIMDELSSTPLIDHVVDGEIMACTRETSIGSARRKKGGGDTTFYIFDVITHEQWERRHTDPLWKRRKMLAQLFEPRPHLVLVPYHVLYNPTLSQMVRLRDEWIAKGLEGVIGKRANKPMHFSSSSQRPDYVLKFKRFETVDLPIIRAEEGLGRLAGTLGAIVCRLPNGGEVNVGTGYTDADRDYLWSIRDELPNYMLETKYQDVKTSNESLSHPTYIRLRKDK